MVVLGLQICDENTRNYNDDYNDNTNWLNQHEFVIHISPIRAKERLHLYIEMRHGETETKHAVSRVKQTQNVIKVYQLYLHTLSYTDTIV